MYVFYDVVFWFQKKTELFTAVSLVVIVQA